MKNRRDLVTFGALSAAALPVRALSAAPLPVKIKKTPKEVAMSNPDLTDFYIQYIAALNARDIKTVEGMSPKRSSG